MPRPVITLLLDVVGGFFRASRVFLWALGTHIFRRDFHPGAGHLLLDLFLMLSF